MRATGLLIQLSIILFACTGSAFAATMAPPSQVIDLLQQQPGEPIAGKQPGWSSKCVRENRKSSDECYVEELLYASNAQPIASVAVRTASDKANPTLLIRVPVGLFLPAGVSVQIDGCKPEPVILQTCEAQGCFGEMQLNPTLISALTAGKELSVVFQNMAKQEVKLPFPLDNFANVYKSIQ